MLVNQATASHDGSKTGQVEGKRSNNNRMENGVVVCLRVLKCKKIKKEMTKENGIQPDSEREEKKRDKILVMFKSRPNTRKYQPRAATAASLVHLAEQQNKYIRLFLFLIIVACFVFCFVFCVVFVFMI